MARLVWWADLTWHVVVVVVLVGCAATICSWVDGVTILSRSMPNYRVTAPSFSGVHVACSGADIIGVRATQLPGKADGAFERSTMQERALFGLCRASTSSAPESDTSVWLLKSKLQFAIYFIMKCGHLKRRPRNRNKNKTIISIAFC